MDKRTMSFITGSVVLFGLCATSAGSLVHRQAPLTARAEEQGISVPLHYVDGYSNWGPTDVYGSATIWPIEGVATITVHFLPRLTDGAKYMWWVVNTVSKRATKIGDFNTSNAGDFYQDVYPKLPLPTGANAVVVTVWSSGDSSTDLGGKRSVAGQFPILALATPTAQKGLGSSNQYTPTVSSTALPGQSTAATGKSGESRKPTYIHKLKSPVPVVVLPQTGGGPFAGALSLRSNPHREG